MQTKNNTGECRETSKTKLFVGIKPGAKREVFRAKGLPTLDTHGSQYNAVIGPFRTMRGARFMAECGGGNPHVQTVGDAERIAWAEELPIRCYDNGGKTADRYTVVYMDQPERQPGLFAAVGMNHEPFHPQGFGQHCTAMPGKRLGKRIAFSSLPADCQKLVRSDLA